MSAAEQLAPTISEPLSWDAICTRYPNQWVCLVEMDRPDANAFEFRTARVIGHGATRRAPVEQAKRWWGTYASIGHYFTGALDAPMIRMFP
jgi:hypothetical protein